MSPPFLAAILLIGQLAQIMAFQSGVRLPAIAPLRQHQRCRRFGDDSVIIADLTGAMGKGRGRVVLGEAIGDSAMDHEERPHTGGVKR
jgi:hypothetical protein